MVATEADDGLLNQGRPPGWQAIDAATGVDTDRKWVTVEALRERRAPTRAHSPKGPPPYTTRHAPKRQSPRPTPQNNTQTTQKSDYNVDHPGHTCSTRHTFSHDQEEIVLAGVREPRRDNR
jgi:hypothetical protein